MVSVVCVSRKDQVNRVLNQTKQRLKPKSDKGKQAVKQTIKKRAHNLIK